VSFPEYNPEAAWAKLGEWGLTMEQQRFMPLLCLATTEMAGQPYLAVLKPQTMTPEAAADLLEHAAANLRAKGATNVPERD